MSQLAVEHINVAKISARRKEWIQDILGEIAQCSPTKIEPRLKNTQICRIYEKKIPIDIIKKHI